MTNIDNIATALSLFEKACIRHAEATQQGDFKTANKSYGTLEKAAGFLKENNALTVLLTFLNHTSAGVRSWAATYLLPVSEKEAVAALEDLVGRTDIHSLNAEMTLTEWRKGNLKF